ncbi:uncharacterized protein [Musca autumnalis]|uniref:uncharacterized protein n=1 Tax=Musca autumnalis TaxID=221902 RepID=UPI003CEB1A48
MNEENQETKRTNIEVEETPLGRCSGPRVENMGGLDSPLGRTSVIVMATSNNAGEGIPKNKFSGSENLKRLGRKIAQLDDFVKSKNNIHKDIQSMMREIQAIYLKVADDLNKEADIRKMGQVDNKQTQTEAWIKPKQPSTPTTPALKRGPKTQSPKENKTKKKKEVPPKTNEQEIKTAEEVTNENVGRSDTIHKAADWNKVQPRSRKKRKSNKPDALIIKTCGDSSYSDILKQVKSEAKLAVLGQNVKAIRKTEKGELLLELNKPAHQNTNEFREAIENVLGPAAEVRALTQEVPIEIKDIDGVSTKEDILQAISGISDEFKEFQPHAIKSLRKAYRGTQTATVFLSSPLANILLEKRIVRIGWADCRIREKLIPRRCYKCLEFGHTAARCKNLNDNSGRCICCGEAGHRVATCKNPPKCMLCKDPLDRSHITGSTVCPRYKEALRQLR